MEYKMKIIIFLITTSFSLTSFSADKAIYVFNNGFICTEVAQIPYGPNQNQYYCQNPHSGNFGYQGGSSREGKPIPLQKNAPNIKLVTLTKLESSINSAINLLGDNITEYLDDLYLKDKQEKSVMMSDMKLALQDTEKKLNTIMTQAIKEAKADISQKLMLYVNQQIKKIKNKSSN